MRIDGELVPTTTETWAREVLAKLTELVDEIRQEHGIVVVLSLVKHQEDADAAGHTRALSLVPGTHQMVSAFGIPKEALAHSSVEAYLGTILAQIFGAERARLGTAP